MSALKSILLSIVAVLWSFFGVRDRARAQEDYRKLTPLRVIAAGLLMGFLFVFFLIFLVRVVVS